MKSHGLAAGLALVLANNAWADTGSINMKVVLQGLVVAEAITTHCEISAQERADLTVFQTALRPPVLTALEARSGTIHPEIPAERRQNLIQEHLDREREYAAKWFSEGTGCEEWNPTAFVGQIKQLNLDQIAKDIKVYGDAPIFYDVLRPVKDWPEVQTFAPPSQQDTLLATMDMHLREAGCTKYSLVGTELVEKLHPEATNLPVFVGAPLRYREKWHFDCGGKAEYFEADFTADSEGPIGTYTVGAIQP